MKYHIDFNTKEMPGKILAVTVELGQDIMRDMDKEVRVDLADHPLYKALERYVHANPRFIKK